MADPSSPTQQDPSPATDPVAAALSEAMPEMRRAQVQGWLGAGAIVLVTALIVFPILNQGGDAWQWMFLPLFLGIALFIAVLAWIKRTHETKVMPILASTMNLTHEKSAKWFFDQIPETFIPRGGKRECDDLMSGTIAGRSFRFAEIKTETGGKNSSTLFDGIVIEVTTRAALPEFLIAPIKQTKGFWLFKGNVNVQDLSYWHSTYGGNGEEYGLWSPSDRPAEREVMQKLMDRMIDMGTSVGMDSSLYSVACTGRDIYVALRHKYEMFRIGGAFANRETIMSDIRSASAELEIPMRLAAEVIRAEEALHEAAARPVT